MTSEVEVKREDEVRLRNEADAYANQVIPEARGEAQRYLEQAEGYKHLIAVLRKCKRGNPSVRRPVSGAIISDSEEE